MTSCSIASSESTAVPNWVELPIDITANILQRLDTIDIVTSACLVCPIWWNICKDPLMWRTIRLINLYDFPYCIYHQSTEICHYAIKQSCGHLEYISIEHFASNYIDLLKLIAENVSNLRFLRLVDCYRISKKVFNEAVKKLPLLEGLNISLSNLSKDSLKAVGQYCPLLTVLILERFWRESWMYAFYDDDAFVIAKTMSGLRHLNIRGNKLSNAGLHAILVGCPHLEYLDIRRCYNVHLDEILKKKWLDQIKNVRLPKPRVYDYGNSFDNDGITFKDPIIDEDFYDLYE